MSETQQPLRVLIDELVYQKIMHFVNKSKYEVSGLGKIVRDEDGNIRVIDAMLLPQRNTHTTTDIEPGDVAEAMYKLRETDGELRFWWHSHVDMAVFWSSTDMDTIKKLPGQDGWFVSTVFNKKHEMRTAISTTVDSACPGVVEPVLVIDQVVTQVVRTLDKDVVDAWDSEYEKNVTNRVPKVVAPPKELSQIPRGVGGGQVSRSPLMDDPDWADAAWLQGMRDSFESSNEPEKRVRASERPIHSVGRPEISEVLNRRDALESELDELEDELDIYEQMGLITEEERIGRRFHEEEGQGAN